MNNKIERIDNIRSVPLEERFGEVFSSLNAVESRVSDLGNRLAPVMHLEQELNKHDNVNEVAPKPPQFHMATALKALLQRINDVYDMLGDINDRLEL